AQEPDDAKAIDLGHLQVEQRQVWRQPLDQLDALGAIRRLADDLDIVVRLKQREKKGAGGPLIIGDDDAQATHRAPVLMRAPGAGARRAMWAAQGPARWRARRPRTLGSAPVPAIGCRPWCPIALHSRFGASLPRRSIAIVFARRSLGRRRAYGAARARRARRPRRCRGR